jgi:hypothetical protein
MKPGRCSWGLLAAAAIVLPAGCGGPARYDVSGKVTYDGRPLAAGVIFFDPDVTKKNDGPQGYAIIKNGTYNTSAKNGRPVVGGPYLARIDGFDGQPGRELPLGKPLFTNFQQAVDLPHATSTRDFNIPAQKKQRRER